MCLTVLGRGCRGCRNVSHRGELRSLGITISVEWAKNMVPSFFPSLTSSPLSFSSFLCGLWQRKPVRMGSAFLLSMVGCKHQPFCFLDRCVVCKQSKVLIHLNLRLRFSWMHPGSLPGLVLSPGLPIWVGVKILFPKLGFYDGLASSIINQGGPRLSTEVRQNHSQTKLEWIYFFFLISVTGTRPVYIYIYMHI